MSRLLYLTVQINTELVCYREKWFDMLKTKINYIGNTQMSTLFRPLVVMLGSNLKI
jgi:hypothetical protein